MHFLYTAVIFYSPFKSKYTAVEYSSQNGTAKKPTKLETTLETNREQKKNKNKK